MNVGVSYPLFFYHIVEKLYPLKVIPLWNDYKIGEIDILILPGGEDISPSIYGEENIASYGINEIRDKIEIKMFNDFVDRGGKLVIGICRGHQLINALLGGKLIQHITNHPSRHSLIKLDKNKILEIFPDTVNSLHHQGVIIPGKGLVSLAEFEGVSEITVGKINDTKIVSMQFHPELMVEPILKQIILST